MFKPAFALAALSLLVGAAAASANEDVSNITFQLSDNRHGTAELALEFSTAPNSHSSHTRTYPWRDLSGVSASELSGGHVNFSVSRDAGILTCNGQARNGRATGFCNFDGSEAYADALARRGVRGAEGEHLLHLALCDFDLATLDEFDRARYPRPSLDQLMAVAVHGVDAAYVRGMADAGHRLGDVDDLVAMRIHDVTPEFVRTLASLGPAWRHISAADLLALRIHGVTPAYARGMAEAGYGGEEPSQLVAMRIHDVQPEFVRELARLGYGGVSSDYLIAARIHDVTPDFVRELQQAGYRDLSIEEAISLRINGIDARYARAMRGHNRN
jgi:hypothetical protein